MNLFRGPDELDLTDGGIVKPLFFLSLPIVVTNLMQTAYNLADTFWLGQYSTEALAAISFGFPVVFLLISIGMGLSIAGSVLVAQHVGAGERAQAEYAASQTVAFSVIASTVLGLASYPFVRPFIDFLGASPEVLPGAAAYMEVIALGLPFMFGFFMFISLMRGAGDTVTPMFVMAGTVVVNIVLDPFLINGWTVVENAPLVGTVGFPELGIEGAAIATIFSRALALVVGFAIMFRGNRGITINLDDMRPDLQYARKILQIGVPASVEGTARALSINAMLIIVGLFPTTVVAAYGIGTRVFSVIFLPAIAVSQGVETMTGQNVGAGKYDRAAETNYVAAKALFVILAAVGVLLFLVPKPIVTVFTDDAAVIDYAATFLRYVALSFGFIGIMRAFTGGFRGTGKTMIAAVISVAALAVVRLPVAYVFSQFQFSIPLVPSEAVFGVRGLWIAFFASNVAGAVIAWLWFRRGTWREGDVRGSPGPGPGPGGLDADEGETTVTDD